MSMLSWMVAIAAFLSGLFLGFRGGMRLTPEILDQIIGEESYRGDEMLWPHPLRRFSNF